LVGPSLTDQVVVVSVLDELTVFEYEHPVGASSRRQPMSDGDRRTRCSQELESASHTNLGQGIDG
jgi:hypothetical protein